MTLLPVRRWLWNQRSHTKQWEGSAHMKPNTAQTGMQLHTDGRTQHLPWSSAPFAE